MADNPKRLYRSRNNKIVSGVCAGIAEYFGFDPTIVRLIYTLLTIFTAVAPFVLIYLIMWIIVPEQPSNNLLD